jgi:archaellum component FlaC
MTIEDLYKIIIKFQQDFSSFRHEMIEFRKETKDEMNEFREETKNEFGKHSKTLIGIENTLNFYGDMYKFNKDSINTLEKRVTVLEAV